MKVQKHFRAFFWQRDPCFGTFFLRNADGSAWQHTPMHVSTTIWPKSRSQFWLQIMTYVHNVLFDIGIIMLSSLTVWLLTRASECREGLWMACRTVSQSTPDIRWVMTHENGNLERANVYCTGSFKRVNVYCKELFRGSWPTKTAIWKESMFCPYTERRVLRSRPCPQHSKLDHF